MAKVLFINPIVREEEEPKHVPMGIAQLAELLLKRDIRYKFTIIMLGELAMKKYLRLLNLMLGT